MTRLWLALLLGAVACSEPAVVVADACPEGTISACLTLGGETEADCRCAPFVHGEWTTIAEWELNLS